MKDVLTAVLGLSVLTGCVSNQSAPVLECDISNLINQVGYSNKIHGASVTRTSIFLTDNYAITAGHSDIDNKIILNGLQINIEDTLLRLDTDLKGTTSEPDIAVYTTNIQLPCLPIAGYNLHDYVGDQVKIIGSVIDFTFPRTIEGSAILLDSTVIDDMYIKAEPCAELYNTIMQLQSKGKGLSGAAVVHNHKILGILVAGDFGNAPKYSRLYIYQFRHLNNYDLALTASKQ